MVAAAVDNNQLTEYLFPETLDTSGNTTSWIRVSNFRNHTIAITTPATLTTAVLQVQGSIDGTYFFGIDPSGNGNIGTNADMSGQFTVTKANATYAVILKDTPIDYIRLKLVSWTGTATTLSFPSIAWRGG